ncbi:MAG: YqgE/AlgH family protein [Actinobacteria bacterium]|nr:YqgE/AlgH family protein [Actinomycetota bacterium]
MDSLQGKLLVSSPALHDPNFRKTVILIAHHDEDGALGFVLSRPLEISAADAVPSLAALPGADAPVFVGGPVQPEAYMVLAEFGDITHAASPVFGRVGFMPADTDPEELGITRLRLFAGYAGWSAGQLEGELEEPAWIVVPAEPDDPFADDPDELWRAVLQRKGGAFELMIDMPFDPGVN